MIRLASTDPVAFATKARQLLLSEPETPREPSAPVHGDHVLSGFNPEPERIARALEAAVLVPVRCVPGGARMILTERSAHLRKHSGQVAFPGGRIDPGETPLEAALREAEEEIGLERRFVTPLGFLPAYYTGTGYRVTGVLALVAADAPLRLNPQEVARVFETPLEELLDLSRFRLESRFWEGRERHYYVIQHPDAYIWGMTAGLIRVLTERLSD